MNSDTKTCWRLPNLLLMTSESLCRGNSDMTSLTWSLQTMPIYNRQRGGQHAFHGGSASAARRGRPPLLRGPWANGQDWPQNAQPPSSWKVTVGEGREAPGSCQQKVLAAVFPSCTNNMGRLIGLRLRDTSPGMTRLRLGGSNAGALTSSSTHFRH